MTIGGAEIKNDAGVVVFKHQRCEPESRSAVLPCLLTHCFAALLSQYMSLVGCWRRMCPLAACAVLTTHHIDPGAAVRHGRQHQQRDLPAMRCHILVNNMSGLGSSCSPRSSGARRCRRWTRSGILKSSAARWSSAGNKSGTGQSGSSNSNSATAHTQQHYTKILTLFTLCSLPACSGGHIAGAAGKLADRSGRARFNLVRLRLAGFGQALMARQAQRPRRSASSSALSSASCVGTGQAR